MASIRGFRTEKSKVMNSAALRAPKIQNTSHNDLIEKRQ